MFSVSELAHCQVDGGTGLRRASEANSHVPREAVVPPEWRAGRDVPAEQRGAVEKRVDHEARAERMAEDDPLGHGSVFLLDPRDQFFGEILLELNRSRARRHVAIAIRVGKRHHDHFRDAIPRRHQVLGQGRTVDDVAAAIEEEQHRVAGTCSSV